MLATNRPADIDFAVLDRVDEMVELPLPTITERKALVRLYFRLFIEEAESKIKVGGADPTLTGDPRVTFPIHHVTPVCVPAPKQVDQTNMEETLAKVAELTEGYSGRAISKLLITIQGHIYSKDAPTIAADELLEVVYAKLDAFEKRRRLLDLQEGYTDTSRDR